MSANNQNSDTLGSRTVLPRPSVPVPKNRAWVFTINNPTEMDEKLIVDASALYCVYGREVGESGTPHLQGYMYFKNAKALSSLKKLLPRAHFEPRRGTHQQARDYCVKDGDYVEYGDPPLTQQEKGEMEKERYKQAYELAKSGKIEEIDADLSAITQRLTR